MARVPTSAVFAMQETADRLRNDALTKCGVHSKQTDARSQLAADAPLASPWHGGLVHRARCSVIVCALVAIAIPVLANAPADAQAAPNCLESEAGSLAPIPPRSSLSQGGTTGSLLCNYSAGATVGGAAITVAVYCVATDAQQDWTSKTAGLSNEDTSVRTATQALKRETRDAIPFYVDTAGNATGAATVQEKLFYRPRPDVIVTIVVNSFPGHLTAIPLEHLADRILTVNDLRLSCAAPTTAPSGITATTATPTTPTTPTSAPPVAPAPAPTPSDAEAACLFGDVDNLGFGFPSGFDVFSGRSTPAHGYPWTPNGTDAPGTDRIIVGSGARTAADGYAGSTSRPANAPQAITLACAPPNGAVVRSVSAQLFVDDFQAPVLGSRFTAVVDGRHWEALETVLNAITQTGPIGKLVTVPVASDLVNAILGGGHLLIDDATSGVGDGFAIDFVRILVNPRAGTAQVRGRVLEAGTNLPLGGAHVMSGRGEATAAADGSYALPGLAAGLAVVTATAPGHLTATRSVDVVGGQTASLDVVLERTLSTTVATSTTVPATTRPPATTSTVPPASTRTAPPTNPPTTTALAPPRVRIITTIPRTGAPLATAPPEPPPVARTAPPTRPTAAATTPPPTRAARPTTTVPVRTTTPTTATTPATSTVPGESLAAPPAGSPEPLQTDRPTLQAARRTVRPGETVDVPIWLSGADAVVALSFEVTFDPVVAVVETGFVGEFVRPASLVVDRATPGRVHFEFRLAAAKSGGGIVATIRFRGGGAGATPLHLSVLSVDAATASVDRLDGGVTLAGASAGDCDGDGRLTTADAMCALRMSVGLVAARPQLDVDGDGAVTSRDSVHILHDTKV